MKWISIAIQTAEASHISHASDASCLRKGGEGGAGPRILHDHPLFHLGALHRCIKQSSAPQRHTTLHVSGLKFHFGRNFVCKACCSILALGLQQSSQLRSFQTAWAKRTLIIPNARHPFRHALVS